MPLKIWASGKEKFLKPVMAFTTITLDSENEDIKVDPGYYVATLNITGNILTEAHHRGIFKVIGYDHRF